MSRRKKVKSKSDSTYNEEDVLESSISTYKKNKYDKSECLPIPIKIEKASIRVYHLKNLRVRILRDKRIQNKIPKYASANKSPNRGVSNRKNICSSPNINSEDGHGDIAANIELPIRISKKVKNHPCTEIEMEITKLETFEETATIKLENERSKSTLQSVTDLSVNSEESNNDQTTFHSEFIIKDDPNTEIEMEYRLMEKRLYLNENNEQNDPNNRTEDKCLMPINIHENTDYCISPTIDTKFKPIRLKRKIPLFKLGSGKCVVKTCGRSYRKSKLVRLFVFPKNTNLCKIWLEKCGFKENTKILPSMRICDIHFEKKYFGKRQLNAGAVPTLYLNAKCAEKKNSVNESHEFIVPDEDHSVMDAEPSDELEESSDGYEEFLNSRTSENCCNHVEGYTLNKDCNVCKCIEDKYLKICEELGCTDNRIAYLEDKYKRLYSEYVRKRISSKEKISILWNRSKKLNLCLGKAKAHTYNFLKGQPSIRNKMYNIIKNLEHMSEAGSAMCSMLLKTKASWNDKEKEVAANIYARSRSIYKYLKCDRKMNLPSINSLKRWLKANLESYNELLCPQKEFEISFESEGEDDDGDSICDDEDKVSVQENLDTYEFDLNEPLKTICKDNFNDEDSYAEAVMENNESYKYDENADPEFNEIDTIDEFDEIDIKFDDTEENITDLELEASDTNI